MFAPFGCFSENLRGFTEKMLKEGWVKEKSWLRKNLKEKNEYLTKKTMSETKNVSSLQKKSQNKLYSEHFQSYFTVYIVCN